MPITSITSDPDSLTMTLIGDYPVPVERLWQAYVDPRQLERFWGPPEWPARFHRHDMVVGGQSRYVMTGPDGTRSAGYWIYERIDEGSLIEVIDGFVGDDGEPNHDMPTMRMSMRFEATPTGSRYVSVTTFPSLEMMQQLVDMGMVEGATSAFAQMDHVVVDLTSFVAGHGTELTILDDVTVRATRVIRGTVEQVWRAHTDPGSVQRWMLGPDGWTMPVCEISVEVGGSYRYEWEAADGSGRFGFEGEVLEAVAPRRAVQTERMAGTDGPSTRNEMTLTPVPGGTLLSVVITYPSSELRDQILATGMVDGMETSYARLEGVLAGL